MSFKLIKLSPVTFHLPFYYLLRISMTYDRSGAWIYAANQPTFEKTPFFCIIKKSWTPDVLGYHGNTANYIQYL